MRARRVAVILSVLGLAAAVVAVYWPVTGHDFAPIDDYQYIRDNKELAGGLTLTGIRWAFTTFHAANWHPLTWLSHLTDVSLFGMDPHRHHLVNLLLHLCNTLLLLVLLQRCTGRWGPSLLMAAFFGLHPTHVENVAWLAERKDLLCTFFWLLAFLAYLRYLRLPSRQAYLPVFFLYLLALLAKPMAVSFPLQLLILDWWPLARIFHASSAAVAQSRRPLRGGDGKGIWREVPSNLLLEKIPLALLALASSLVTLAAQSRGGSVTAFDAVPMGMRLANLLHAYPTYIAKLLWPRHLFLFYPFTGHAIDPGTTILYLGILIVLTFCAWHWRLRYPFALAGWAWFLVTLLPVIGIIKVGLQSMADRYLYVPSIGFFLILVSGVFAAMRGRRSAVLLLLSALAIPSLMLLTSRQLAYWRSMDTFIDHNLAFAPDHYFLLNLKGNVLYLRGQADEALPYYLRSARENPRFPDAAFNTGLTLLKLRRYPEAVDPLRRALALLPQDPDVHYQLGYALLRMHSYPEARIHLTRALDLQPSFPEALFAIGLTHFEEHSFAAAIPYFRGVIETSPPESQVPFYLGSALLQSGDAGEAVAFLTRAVQSSATPLARMRLAEALRETGRLDEAARYLEEVVREAPANPEARFELGLLRGMQGRTPEAEREILAALKAKPDFPAAHYNLGMALEARGRVAEALGHYRRAIELDPTMAEAFNNAGSILAEQGQGTEAAVMFGKALALKPDYEVARRNLERLRGKAVP